MKIRVERTSTCGTLEIPPCEGVELGLLPEFISDNRTFKSFQEHDERLSGWNNTPKWEELGKNHKVHEWGISREIPRTGSKKSWYFNLNSLEDLKLFLVENGACVIQEQDGELTLEIYDDYRE